MSEHTAEKSKLQEALLFSEKVWHGTTGNAPVFLPIQDYSANPSTYRKGFWRIYKDEQAERDKIHELSGNGFLNKIQELILQLYRETKWGNTAQRLSRDSLISELRSSVFRICTHSEFGIALAEVKELLKFRIL